jgi:hypothetical protein
MPGFLSSVRTKISDFLLDQSPWVLYGSRKVADTAAAAHDIVSSEPPGSSGYSASGEQILTDVTNVGYEVYGAVLDAGRWFQP